ncbi:hypothetical protein N0V90_007575 [Kalmusia sp. IMI 367209]|nr:hypothetical protein N0V90_007575 [Kalmusia sp. IMI 367209]
MEFYQSEDRPLISGADNPLVTIIVGENKTAFTIHASLLINSSEFFRAALQGGFSEAGTKTITFHDESPTTIQLFKHWLYHEQFPDLEKGDNLEMWQLFEGPNDRGATKSHQLVELYVFAEMYQVSYLKGNILRALYKHVFIESPAYRWKLPRGQTLHYAFDHLPAGAPLLRLLADAYYWRGYACDYKEGDSDEFPIKFLLAVARRYADKPSRVRPAGTKRRRGPFIGDYLDDEDLNLNDILRSKGWKVHGSNDDCKSIGDLLTK